MSYAASSALGRENARITNTTQRMTTIDHYEWRHEPVAAPARYPAAPPFTDRPTVRHEPTGQWRWEIDVVAACGHKLARLAYGVTGEGHVPPHIEWRYPIGKRKRCPECPPPERKPRKERPAPAQVPYVPGTVYRPAPDELAVVRLECGEDAIIERIDGPKPFRGLDPVEMDGEVYRPTEVYVVPFDGHQVGWGHRGWSAIGPKVGNGQHRLDRPVWKEAEKLLRTHRCVYVRVEEQPYYNKTRHTAVAVRPHTEETPDA